MWRRWSKGKSTMVERAGDFAKHMLKELANDWAERRAKGERIKWMTQKRTDCWRFWHGSRRPEGCGIWSQGGFERPRRVVSYLQSCSTTEHMKCTGSAGKKNVKLLWVFCMKCLREGLLQGHHGWYVMLWDACRRRGRTSGQAAVTASDGGFLDQHQM